MIDLTLNNSTGYKAYDKRFFQKVLNCAVKEVKLNGKKNGLSINLVGPARIKSLNQKYRAKNKTTDVLSFPLVHDPRKLSTTRGAENKENAIVELGDIFICPDFVKAKRVTKSRVLDSRKVNRDHELTQEMKFLTVHGFLHLLGYDHPAPSYSADRHSKKGRAWNGASELSVEAKKMFELQDKILNKL